MIKVLEKVILFDGGEGPAKWKASGLSEGAIPDQYVKRCNMGAVNLNIYSMGWYQGCLGCEKRKDCQDYGNVAGEQAEI